MEKGTVCVTGGTGYLASWMIKLLLEEGYCVNTTVRSASGSRNDVSYLTNLPGAPGRLNIYEADLSKPETFEAPIKGCIGVFHVAHPMDFATKESTEVITERAIKASIGILQACVDSKTVQKLVYTSSASAVLHNGKKHSEVLGEESWTDVDYINTHKEFGSPWYYISKTLTERAVLEFAKREGFDVVTVNPSLVHGPFLGTVCPASVCSSMAMILGDTHKYKLHMRTPFVHVDDVVRAHIHLFEFPNAKGRYICSKTEVPIEELYNFLSARYPEHKIPNINFFKREYVERMMYPRLSSQKLLDTGFQFKYGLEEIYDDAIDCCKRNNLL